MKITRITVGGLLLVSLALAPVAQAQSAESKFHNAYYLENERGDYAAAARIYDDVASDRRAPDELKKEAAARRQACREEIACADFAKLMPPDALAYIELSRPGDQLERLLDMLGLMRADGQIVGDAAHRIAVSPELVRELLGIRGLAVALTGFNPAEEKPMGVAVLHAGDIGVIRGLIETMLPAGGIPEEPIAGYPTFNIEGEALITLTHRLAIVSTQRIEIEGVVDRLRGELDQSLADNPDMMAALQNRDPSLLFFCVNFKPVMPLINAAMAAAGGQSQEAAVAQAVLDLKSLKMLTGGLGVNDDGLYLDVNLALEKGHRNLAFHFLRLPRIDEEILKRIPAGAAAFVAGALGDPDAKYDAPGDENAPVTALDIGREIFANIASFAVFAMPIEMPDDLDGEPAPPVAAVFKVHDPEKSQALWTQMLGVASIASGAGVLEGQKVEVAGLEARRFTYPDGISVYLTVFGDHVIISPYKQVIAAAVQTRKGGRSVLNDPVFAGAVKKLDRDSTLAFVAHPGRCLAMAKPYMSRRDLEEAAPFTDLLTDAVAAVVMRHSDNELRFAAAFTGLPDLGPFITSMIEQDQRREYLRRELRKSRHDDDWRKALEVVAEMKQDNPGDPNLLWAEFKILALQKQDRDAALKLSDVLCQAFHKDAYSLNNYAWALLTEDEFGDGYESLALKMSQRSNEITNRENWAYLDTLALALFKTGDVETAVETERKAQQLCGDGSGKDAVAAALQRFEASLER